MPGRSTTLHGFSLEPSRSLPTAVIAPSEQSKVIGAIIKLDGRGSLSPDGDDLTYTWMLEETPLGSTVETLTEIEDDGSVVTFVPDMTGQFTIGLTVSTPYRTSEQVTATVDVQSVLAPYTLRTTPDGNIMLGLISRFWQMVDGRQVFSTIWSGYMQIVAADLLRLFQIDYAKSIATIQPYFQRRWLPYFPRLDLDASLHTGVYGYHQSGSSSYTGSGTAAAVGIIISAQEVILLDGAPTLDAVGETVRIYSSGGDPGNVGEYTINRLNSDASGYIVSAAAPFPSPADEILSSGEDLVTMQLDDEVYVADVSVDFSALGVVVGDSLRIESGADADYYRIVGVGTADGLANERTLRLAESPTQSKSNCPYTIFKALRILAERTASPSTDTVYIPEGDADLDLYTTSGFTGTGTLENLFEIVVEERHVFSALVGQQITITSGADGGKSFTIAGVNDSSTGYLVGSVFSEEEYPAEVSYEIPLVTDISSRVLVLGGRAYEILTAELDPVGVAEEDGGYGPVWVITLTEAAAPSGQEGLEWRIAAAIESTEYEDFEEEGIAAGDLLVLEVVRGDEQIVGSIPCYVLGAVGSRIAFDIGTEELSAGTNGSLSPSEILELATDLRIPRVYTDPEDEDEVLITLTAAEIQTLLNSRGFKTDYYNLPISSSTDIDLESYTVRLRVSHVVRNCRVPVDETVASVPSLFEYIAEPEYGEDDDGNIWLIGEDSEVVSLDREPLELIENRDYSVSADDTLSGSNLETTAASATLRIPNGDLIDRDVRVGDYVDVESGFDQGRYVIQVIYDSENVRAVTSLGEVPANDATGLSYTLQRRTAGNFLRFVDGMFTPSSPAPERFWAQLSLFDNSDYIEDNFGVLVGITKEQLDEYGGSQITYKGAVTGLMYAWTNGPTLRNISIGCHILVGLPVTEVVGQIIQIDEDYDSDNGVGRVLVEDLDEDGNGTGLVRIYQYAVADDDTLSDFAGLATNQETGSPFAVLDVVPAFTPLSKAVIVSDYVSDPLWWAVGGATGADEVKKFHTWQVQLDAHEVDSRDIPLIYDFCMGIRPIYTKPEVVLALYLSDDVTVEDELSLELDLFFADDPTASLEATRMVDSYNGSSLAHRLLDYGSFATRTLFEGRDLVTTAGSGTVTSTRGGFVGNLTETPLSHAPGEAVGLLGGVNDWFEDDVYYRGGSLVRAGDILFIREGVNRARFEIISVTDDNTLEVAELSDWPPRSFDPAVRMEAGTGQVFQIQRRDAENLVSASDATVDSYDAGTDTTVIESLTGNFRWNGVAVGDRLVVEDGADYGVHEVLQVGYVDGFGDIQDLDTKLTIDGQLTEAGSFSYTVRRDVLRTNPLLQRTDGSTSVGSTDLTSAVGLLLESLEYGDILIPSTGTDADQVFTVVDVPDDTTIVVDRAFTATESSVEFVVARPALFEQDGLLDSDWNLERFCLYDEVSITFVEPMSTVVSVTDLTLSGSTATSAATDLETAGVAVGDKLEIPNTSDNSGAWAISAVSGYQVTVEGTFHVDEGPVSGTFLTSAADWTLLDDTATLSGTFNLEFGPMMSTSTPGGGTSTFSASATVTGSGTAYETDISVGDVVRLSGDDDLSWAVVIEVVSDTELTLDRSYTGTGGSGAIEAGVPGGMVHVGDVFEADGLGTFVVEGVQGAVLTFTSDTGVSPSASYTGHVSRSF